MSYCLAMSAAMAVAMKPRLHKMWANTGEWEANYFKICWDSGQRIMPVNFIEKYYDEANDNWEGCGTSF